MGNVKFKEYDCELVYGKYGNGQTAIQLYAGGEVVAVATVAVDDRVGDGEVVIKDYTENKGMLDTLVGAGVITKPIRKIREGYVELYVCTLLQG